MLMQQYFDNSVCLTQLHMNWSLQSRNESGFSEGSTATGTFPFKGVAGNYFSLKKIII